MDLHSMQDRQDFQSRLATALSAVGCQAKPTALARQYNLRAHGATITTHGARKWLMGEAIPTQDKLLVLANWLCVSPQWLRFGEGRIGEGVASNDGGAIPHDEAILLGDFRRLDERSQAVVRDLIHSLLAHHHLRN